MMNEPKLHNREQRLQSYYKWHALFYDATRWSFLFGRSGLIRSLPDLARRPRILEIGCGTGKNIELLESTFPQADITGIDLSGAMLKKAEKRVEKSTRVTLLQQNYGVHETNGNLYNLIILSYSLTMMGAGMENILHKTARDLSADGYIAVVDFHTTSQKWFRRWMMNNHVRMDGALLPLLNLYYKPVHRSVKKAYGGLWDYLHFIGRPSLT